MPREPTRGHLVPVMELGKRLLQSSRDGDTDGVRELMGKGAPFSTDWVRKSQILLLLPKYTHNCRKAFLTVSFFSLEHRHYTLLPKVITSKHVKFFYVLE